MMIWTAKVHRRGALLAFVCVAAAALAAAVFLGRERGRTVPVPVDLTTNGDRVAYLAALGWEVEEDPIESYTFQLPDPLEEPYLSYNALQIPQGFDLSDWCGRTVERYTYTVTNWPDRPDGVQADLYVCDGEAVAGDILCPGPGGFQEALVR